MYESAIIVGTVFFGVTFRRNRNLVASARIDESRDLFCHMFVVTVPSTACNKPAEHRKKYGLKKPQAVKRWSTSAYFCSRYLGLAVRVPSRGVTSNVKSLAETRTIQHGFVVFHFKLC